MLYIYISFHSNSTLLDSYSFLVMRKLRFKFSVHTATWIGIQTSISGAPKPLLFSVWYFKQNIVKNVVEKTLGLGTGDFQKKTILLNDRCAQHPIRGLLSFSTIYSIFFETDSLNCIRNFVFLPSWPVVFTMPFSSLTLSELRNDWNWFLLSLWLPFSLFQDTGI